MLHTAAICLHSLNSAHYPCPEGILPLPMCVLKLSGIPMESQTPPGASLGPRARVGGLSTSQCAGYSVRAVRRWRMIYDICQAQNNLKSRKLGFIPQISNPACKSLRPAPS